MLRKILESQTNFSLCFGRLLKIFIVGTSILLLVAYISFKKDFTKEVQKQTLIDSVKITNQLYTSLFYSENITNIVAKTLAREGVNNQAKIAAILTAAIPKIDYEKHNIFTTTLFNFLNEKGDLIVTSSDGILPTPIMVSKEKRSWITDSKTRPWKFHLAKNDIGIVSKEPIIPVGFGISDAKNRFLGTLSCGISVNKLRNLLEASLNNGLTNFAILNDDGSLIISSNNFEHKLIPEIQNSIIQDFAENGVVQHVNIKIANRDFLYSKIPNYPKLGVLVGYNRASFRQEFWSGFQKTFTYFLYFSLFALILIFLLKKRLINPVISLSKLSRKLSNNNTNFYLPDSHIEEIQILSKPIKDLQKIIKNQVDLKNTKTKDNKHKKEFLSSISHEFTNTTNSIIGVSEFIKSDMEFRLKSQNKQFSTEEIAKYQEFLDDIKNLSEEVLLLAQDIIDINQTNYGIFEIEKLQSVNLEELSLRCIKLLRTYAIKNHKIISVNFIKSKDCNFIVNNLNDKLVKQALVNIIRSAIKFSKNNNKIEVTLRAIENEVSELLRDSLLKKIISNKKLEKNHRDSLIKVVEKSRPRVNIIFKIKTSNQEECENFSKFFEDSEGDQEQCLDKKNLSVAKDLIEMQGGIIEVSTADSPNIEIKITF
jgi:signal transduction histidine kinase